MQRPGPEYGSGEREKENPSRNSQTQKQKHSAFLDVESEGEK